MSLIPFSSLTWIFLILPVLLIGCQLSVADEQGDKGDKEGGEMVTEPMPNAPCPMPHAQCPMPHAPQYFFGKS
ncbi:hypothetical protein [Calothrix sp. FACHB-168]|uniref:hypothetical protein n=1 Tax=Calothrix sp. FACHB-168 TaxID=2692780 RepID=UPI0030D98973